MNETPQPPLNPCQENKPLDVILQPLDVNDFPPYFSVMDYRKRITIEPGKRGGKPCIRGLRITVYEVLDYNPARLS